QLETVNQEQATVRPQKEYYPWFVGFALLLCFYWMSGKADLSIKQKTLVQNRKVLKS
ncbi:MAG: hypothetical protein HYX60_00475, partial [Legionella longbeachae]|nr:hypothetical protein [Legionella longbeachae]